VDERAKTCHVVNIAGILRRFSIVGNHRPMHSIKCSFKCSAFIDTVCDWRHVHELMYSVVKVDHVRGAEREVMFTCDQKEGTKMTRYSIFIEGTRQ
jgi:hypothetical protein